MYEISRITSRRSTGHDTGTKLPMIPVPNCYCAGYRYQTATTHGPLLPITWYRYCPSRGTATSHHTVLLLPMVPILPITWYRYCPTHGTATAHHTVPILLITSKGPLHHMVPVPCIPGPEAWMGYHHARHHTKSNLSVTTPDTRTCDGGWEAVPSMKSKPQNM